MCACFAGSKGKHNANATASMIFDFPITELGILRERIICRLIYLPLPLGPTTEVKSVRGLTLWMPLKDLKLLSSIETS